MRHPARQMADGIDLLRLEQLGDRLLALLGAHLDAPLQVFVQALQCASQRTAGVAIRSQRR